MSEATHSRKMEHIRILGEDPDTDRRGGAFDAIRLRHRALPELDLDRVDSSLTFLGRQLSFPMLISSMTGGDDAGILRINHRLAEAASECRVALGVGSQRVQFERPEAEASFALRQRAPDALLFANLGAVQLNRGLGVDACRRAVEVVGADAIFLHLNPLQEAVQPEGDTCFAGLADKIGEVVEALDVPVVVKEIGCGLSLPDAELLAARGIRFLDVAGSGGTSWSRVEHHRRAPVKDDGLGLLLQDWGTPTPLALRDLSPLRERGITLIASGGLRNALDMVKSIVLGARLAGMAGPFLEPAQHSTEAVVGKIEALRTAFHTIQFLVGAATLRELHGNGDMVL